METATMATSSDELPSLRTGERVYREVVFPVDDTSLAAWKMGPCPWLLLSGPRSGQPCGIALSAKDHRAGLCPWHQTLAAEGKRYVQAAVGDLVQIGELMLSHVDPEQRRSR